MEIKGEDYKVLYDSSTHTVTFEGIMRLHGNDYNAIMTLLQDIVDKKPATATMDLRKLDFLNSSGINHLFKFAVKLRNQTTPTELVVLGSSKVPWQQKSLKNLRMLNRKAELKWD